MSSGSSTIRKLAAIMFADIVGYTALMQADESRAKQLRDKHRQVMEDYVAARDGEIVQYYGDGALCLFGSAKEAVVAALEIQSKLLKEPVVPHRIGVHIGDIVRDEAGVYGNGVNVASRIESLAIPGSVLLSDKVNLELGNHPSITTRSLGEFRFKNVQRPVGVYALVHQDIKVPEAGDLASNVASRASKSIAVIPFDCLESSEEGTYFADGLSEEIAGGLSKVDGLSIIARTTCLALQKSGNDLNTVARQSNVSHILNGRVRSAGNRVRVSVELSNTADGFQVWSEVYESGLDDIFAVQDEIARHVVSAMKVNFGAPTQAEPIIAPPTRSAEAHKLYLKGVHHLQKHNPENVQKAADTFNEALALDGHYSAARCGLSHCYAFLGSCGVLPPTEGFAQALSHAIRAIEDNPRNAEAHLAMANIKFYNYWDWEGAFMSLQKAEELGLRSALLHQSFGLYYLAVGRPADGVDRMQKALEQDPLSVPMINMLGTLYLFNEDYEKSIETFTEALDLDPEFRSAIQARGVARVCLRDYHTALSEFEDYHARVNNPRKALTGLIISHHKLGNDALVKEYFGRLYERLEENTNAAVEIDLALAHAGVGQYDQAMDFLNKVYEKRFSVACMGVIWIMRCPYFKDLWEQPAFKELLLKMGLAA